MDAKERLLIVGDFDNDARVIASPGTARNLLDQIVGQRSCVGCVGFITQLQQNSRFFDPAYTDKLRRSGVTLQIVPPTEKYHPTSNKIARLGYPDQLIIDYVFTMIDRFTVLAIISNDLDFLRISAPIIERGKKIELVVAERARYKLERKVTNPNIYLRTF